MRLEAGWLVGVAVTRDSLVTPGLGAGVPAAAAALFPSRDATHGGFQGINCLLGEAWGIEGDPMCVSVQHGREHGRG